MINAGIVGGTGYTGVELLRILVQHPKVKLKVITSRQEAGTGVDELFSSLRGQIALKFSDPAKVDFSKCDVVFFCNSQWDCHAAGKSFTRFRNKSD